MTEKRVFLVILVLIVSVFLSACRESPFSGDKLMQAEELTATEFVQNRIFGMISIADEAGNEDAVNMWKEVLDSVHVEKSVYCSDKDQYWIKVRYGENSFDYIIIDGASMNITEAIINPSMYDSFDEKKVWPDCP